MVIYKENIYGYNQHRGLNGINDNGKNWEICLNLKKKQKKGVFAISGDFPSSSLKDYILQPMSVLVFVLFIFHVFFVYVF